jgi:hypothetical protein
MTSREPHAGVGDALLCVQTLVATEGDLSCGAKSPSREIGLLGNPISLLYSSEGIRRLSHGEPEESLNARSSTRSLARILRC